MRTLLTALLGCLAACATTAGERVLLLESDSYGCGVEAGLGCGLMLAPVLVQIDALEDVGESRVSWNGHLFRLALRPGADPARVVEAVDAILEGDVRLAPASATLAEGDRWRNSAETVELSRYEAGRIAADYAAQIAQELGLEPDDAALLETAMREELTVAFERAHAAGGTVERLWTEWPEAEQRFLRRLPEFLSAEQVSQVQAFIERERADG